METRKVKIIFGLLFMALSVYAACEFARSVILGVLPIIVSLLGFIAVVLGFGENSEEKGEIVEDTTPKKPIKKYESTLEDEENTTTLEDEEEYFEDYTETFYEDEWK